MPGEVTQVQFDSPQTRQKPVADQGDFLGKRIDRFLRCRFSAFN